MRCAIFDLDGTLVNTIDDLGRAVDYVLECYNKEKKWTVSDYTNFVGNGARNLLDRSFEHTLSEQQLDEAFELFRKKYNEILLDNAFVYDGIKTALDTLKEQGIKLAVVTNKPHDSAVKMVEKLFGKNYFDAVVGAKEDVPKKPNPATTLVALNKLDCEAKNAIFFGDSDIDIYTAKNAGIEPVGCSWGFRSFECLFAAGPSVIIDKPEYIAKLF
ncbi:MAG: HAD family hydrolase [Eubacterium sp.]